MASSDQYNFYDMRKVSEVHEKFIEGDFDVLRITFICTLPESRAQNTPVDAERMTSQCSSMLTERGHFELSYRQTNSGFSVKTRLNVEGHEANVVLGIILDFFNTLRPSGNRIWPTQVVTALTER